MNLESKWKDWLNWFYVRNGFVPTRVKVPSDELDKLRIESRKAKRWAEDPYFPQVTFCGIPVDRR
jgi:hypothetical protein